MTRPARLLLPCVLALAALWPSSSRAHTSKLPGYPAALARSLGRVQWPTLSRSKGLATARFAGARFTLTPPRDPRWEGGIAYDDHAPPVPISGSPTRNQVGGWMNQPYYAAPLLPLIEPTMAAWAVRGESKTTALELGGAPTFSYAGSSSDSTALGSDRNYQTDVIGSLTRLGVTTAGPTLLRYSDEETNVSVIISPGGPCTGACLKVAGSF